MKNDIKILYKFIMNKHQHQRVGWHTNYKNLVERVEEIKSQLLAGKNISDVDLYSNESFRDKYDFLHQLIYERNNFVASRGQSIFRKERFNELVNDEEYLTSLQNLIKETTSQNLNDFNGIWHDKIGGNNPLLTNRIAAACTTNLSTTVNESDFNDAFNWLKENEYIDDSVTGNNWFEKNESLINFFREKIKDEDFQDSNIKVDQYWLNIFVWLIYVNMANPFKLKKQIVKYGAPGTGKTYQAKETAEMQFDVWKNTTGEKYDIKFTDCFETVQFHPSYTYEDFIEGLRPIPDENGQAQLKLQNGIFKELCIKAGKWEVDLFTLNAESLKDKKFNEIRIGDLTDVQAELISKGDYWNYIFELKDKSQRIEKVIPPYFILIDEINRAELSRVFGELMYSLEYRGTAGSIKTQYSQLNTKETGMLKVSNSYQFFVPHNLYMIATMNTIDRSVDSFDFALRRRFSWEEVNPSEELLRYHLESYNKSWSGLAQAMGKLNAEITGEQDLLGKDYCIGHAYFWELKYDKTTSLTDVKRLIWRDSLSPLLSEYLRGTGRENDLLKTFENKFYAN